ncbi:MAG TPA: hypothetical protein VGJ66_15250 [Pyrinomonadaceae bacterium]|jgi:hypothetical protein
MTIVKGVNEVVHLPLYDSLFVRAGKQLSDVVSSNVLKFFVNIQGKTKLETNMQSSALLPHWNTFEARALRVVISDLPEGCIDARNGTNGNGNGNGHRDVLPSDLREIVSLFEERRHQKLDDKRVTAARETLNALREIVQDAEKISKDYDDCLGLLQHFCHGDRMGQMLKLLGQLRSIRDELVTVLTRTRVQVKKHDALKKFVEELKELAPKGEERDLASKLDRAIECLYDFVKLTVLAQKLKGQKFDAIDACIAAAEESVTPATKQPHPPDKLRERLEALAREFERCQALARLSCGQQILGKLLYNSVTTLFVGEKIMIQMPTWFFPAGAGPYSEDGQVVTNGFPTPQATFRFAEPVIIDTQQHFRVELEIPEGDTFQELQGINGPFLLWVVLDGYMTRDVQ